MASSFGASNPFLGSLSVHALPHTLPACSPQVLSMLVVENLVCHLGHDNGSGASRAANLVGPDYLFARGGGNKVLVT